MDYRINPDEPQGKCRCGHTWAAHGSKGMVCCACDCPLYTMLSGPEWLTGPKDGSPRCLSINGAQQCEKPTGHEGPHQECNEVWVHG